MRLLFLFLLPLSLLAQTNPPAEGFDLAGSDPEAVSLADSVMAAQGGRTAWEGTRYLQWTFMGRRTLLWDKWTGWVRVDWKNRDLKVIININTNEGRVQLKGVEQTHPDSLAKYLDMGKRVWINDSYWLCMPFKLKDSGVTLKLLSDKDKTDDGRAASKIQLTFKGVGVTPDNKYHVWIDRETNLVSQWAFFRKYSDSKPEFINVWAEYATYGKIKLSAGRGPESRLSDISAPEYVAENKFIDF